MTDEACVLKGNNKIIIINNNKNTIDYYASNKSNKRHKHNKTK